MLDPRAIEQMSGKSGLQRGQWGFCCGALENTFPTKSTIHYRATIQCKYLYENINFCDHKDYIEDICLCSTCIFSECRNTKQKGLRLSIQKEGVRGEFLDVAATKGEAELSDQQSGLFSKYWRVLTLSRKLPFIREAGIQRKQLSSFTMQSSRGVEHVDTQDSEERDPPSLNGLIINSHKILWKQNISPNQTHFTVSTSNLSVYRP